METCKKTPPNGEKKHMKEYKVVNLNKAIHMSRDKDLAQMEENINALVAEGWELQRVISPNGFGRRDDRHLFQRTMIL